MGYGGSTECDNDDDDDGSDDNEKHETTGNM